MNGATITNPSNYARGITSPEFIFGGKIPPWEQEDPLTTYRRQFSAPSRGFSPFLIPPRSGVKRPSTLPVRATRHTTLFRYYNMLWQYEILSGVGRLLGNRVCSRWPMVRLGKKWFDFGFWMVCFVLSGGCSITLEIIVVKWIDKSFRSKFFIGWNICVFFFV